MTSLDTSHPGSAHFINATSLMPGDVLLMLGEGPLSQLISWCDDSIYSHASIVADNGELIEASTSGVRRYALRDRLVDTAHYHYIDAFRPLADDGSPLGDMDRDAVLAQAHSLLGIPYPVDMLATLGVILAVRGKIPDDMRARVVVREALDRLVHNDQSRMVCSEVVYRALSECAITPAGRLAPRIVPGPRGTSPFPQIDWVALWQQMWPLLHPERQSLLTARMRETPINRLSSAAPAIDVLPEDNIDKADLLAQLQQAREALGIPAHNLLRAGADDSELPDLRPNPKLVTPQDLASTPSHTVLGRLMARSATA